MLLEFLRGQIHIERHVLVLLHTKQHKQQQCTTSSKPWLDTAVDTHSTYSEYICMMVW